MSSLSPELDASAGVLMLSTCCPSTSMHAPSPARPACREASVITMLTSSPRRSPRCRSACARRCAGS
eukprot:3457068-Amphidinium_carterae.1